VVQAVERFQGGERAKIASTSLGIHFGALVY
jgi:hypothetical protein